MTLKKITQKSIPLSPHRLRQLKYRATHNLYRLNATSADCYAFSVDAAGQKHLDGTISKGNDYSGGWDWSRMIVDTRAQYIYMLDGTGFYEITEKI